MEQPLDTSSRPESFRGLLLRHRGRTGLIQRDLAARAGVSRGAIQDWEAGVNYPTVERLQAFIRVLLEANGLTAGHEARDARNLWAAAEREAPRMRTPFDEEWFATLLATQAGTQSSLARAGRAQDWGEAPDTAGFVGRREELTLLRGWVLDERSRFVAVLGMGGIGKTSLAAKLAQEVTPSFERVYWRSLRDAPPFSEWLVTAIGFLSDHDLVPPTSDSERLIALLQLLRSTRCLLVLDNYESLFEPGQQVGHYRNGVAGYGRVLHLVAGASHESCLLLTSREAPPEMAALNIRAVHLSGLGVDDARVLLAPKQLDGNPEQWSQLNGRFAGNGLALKLVGQSIRELFGGEIGSFLEQGVSSAFGGIRQVLAEQVNRSSAMEQRLLCLLAVEREPVGLLSLLDALGPAVSQGAGLEAVEALRRRSLIERSGNDAVTAFTLQSVLLDYVNDWVVETVVDEVARGQPDLLVELALIKAQGKDYVRQTQERLIGTSILQRLNAQYDIDGTHQRLVALLQNWRGRSQAEQGYGPGNVVNLLRLLRVNLRGLDLSRLTIQQAYLAEADAQDASLVASHLVDTILAEAFDFPGSVALSGDASLLAAGTSTGQVLLWRVADRTLVWAAQGHTGAVWGAALSADGQLLASSAGDGNVRLWDVRTGQPLATLEGHTGTVWDVALSADGQLVASSGADGTVRLWESGTGRQLRVLEGHAGGVWGVALSSSGHLVASGGADGTVRLWDTQTGEPLARLESHGGVRGVSLSADGQLIAAGGLEGTVQVWNASTGRQLASLKGQPGGIWGVALSPNGQLVVGAGADGILHVWDIGTGRRVSTLLGHTGAVWAVALAADNRLLASSGGDGTVRLWEPTRERPLATLQGHTGGVWTVALSAHGDVLASGAGDGGLRLWDVPTGRLTATLRSHTGAIWTVALAADGQLVAGGGSDGRVRVWDVRSRDLLATLDGHIGGVWGVALSADGKRVASGGADGMVRLWDTATRRLVGMLHGHVSLVRDVALSADGQLLASGGEDGTVRLWRAPFLSASEPLPGQTSAAWSVGLSADGRLVVSGDADGTVHLWDTVTGHPVATFAGHTGTIWRVALSADGQLLASSGTDGTVRLWSVATGRPLRTLRGDSGTVRGMALSTDGQVVAGGSFNGTVTLWDAGNGAALRTLRAERSYERLDITGLIGVTSAQRAALLALGAVEQETLVK